MACALGRRVATHYDAVPLTLDEFAGYADPAISEAQLTAIIGALPRFVKVSSRRSGQPGRPKAKYSDTDLMDLHAAIAKWL